MRVIVVGASSGLGAAIMLWHAYNGDEVLCVGRSIDRVDDAICDLSNVTKLRCDVQAPSDLSNLIDLCSEADIVYYCAALADPAPANDILDVNFLAFTKLAASLQNYGLKIVAISSLAAVISFEDIPFYCASKSALETWVKALPKRFSKSFLIVRPGKFKSELFVKQEELMVDRLPHDVARSVCEIAMRASGQVNLGGFRDRAACFLAPIFGEQLVRRFLL